MRGVWLGAVGVLAASLAQAGGAPPAPGTLDAATAARRGLALSQRGAGNFIGKQTCFSCHHQGLPMLACAEAGRAGIEFDAAGIRKQVEYTTAYFTPLVEEMKRGKGVQNGNDAVVYGLAGLAAAAKAPDTATEAMAQFMLGRQLPDGSWFAATERPPFQGSFFHTTALAIVGLKAYCPKEKAGDLPGIVNRAAAWLRKSRTVDTEDMVWQVRGLAAAGDAAGAAKFARTLRAAQRADGGWAQTTKLKSDAYATGTALLALSDAGVNARDEAIQKGVAFLLQTQEADGSWMVKKRAEPQQVFFDNGDPHGYNQFISFAATNFATMALLRTLREGAAGAAVAAPGRPAADNERRKAKDQREMEKAIGKPVKRSY